MDFGVSVVYAYNFKRKFIYLHKYKHSESKTDAITSGISNNK